MRTPKSKRRDGGNGTKRKIRAVAPALTLRLDLESASQLTLPEPSSQVPKRWILLFLLGVIWVLLPEGVRADLRVFLSFLAP